MNPRPDPNIINTVPSIVKSVVIASTPATNIAIAMTNPIKIMTKIGIDNFLDLCIRVVIRLCWYDSSDIGMTVSRCEVSRDTTGTLLNFKNKDNYRMIISHFWFYLFRLVYQEKQTWNMRLPKESSNNIILTSRVNRNSFIHLL